MVVDAWNEIAWLYTQVNVMAPVAGYEEPEDLNDRADLDKKLAQIGVVFTPEHFKDVYGLKETEFTVGEPSTSANDPDADPCEDNTSDFAAPSSRKTTLAEKAQYQLEKALSAMLPAAIKSSAEFVMQFENGIKKADSYEELEALLIDMLAPAMSPGALESFLARAMTAAAGYGAAAVSAEAGNG